MGIRNWLSQHLRPAAAGPSAAVPGGEEQNQLTAEESADLEAAWAELRQAAVESNVTSFRACSRNGRSWAEDPEAVRAIAATIGNIMNDAAKGPKHGSESSSARLEDE